MFPALFTAIKMLLSEATPIKPPVTPEVLEDQEIPSDEVSIVPEEPTATNLLFPYVTLYKYRVVPEVLAVQDIPSVDVMIYPVVPTATNLHTDEVHVLNPLEVSY